MVSKTYYNEFDKKKCAALKTLIEDGHISKGDIDDRPIKEVMPDDVRNYERCHFFAGIGLWDYALDLARWEKGRRVWTGSCPCQPFSIAGRQKGKKDDRHLWPEWFRLIEECQPSVIFGEQVKDAITKGWLDDVYQGLEENNYAVGSIVMPASAIGAPHRRERLWFVGYRDEVRELQQERSVQDQRERVSDASSVGDSGRITERHKKTGISRERKHSNAQAFGTKTRNGFTDTSLVGNTKHNGYFASEVPESKKQAIQHDTQRKDSTGKFEGASESGNVAYPDSSRPQRYRGFEQEQIQERWEREERHTWSSGVWINCPDEKQRLVEPRIPLLVNGYPERVGVIHSAGDAIVPQLAAEFIKAFTR